MLVVNHIMIRIGCFWQTGGLCFLPFPSGWTTSSAEAVQRTGGIQY